MNQFENPPLTSKQAAYLGKLITKHGRDALRKAKRTAGVPIETTSLKLTRSQAAAVIRELLRGTSGDG